jgi:TolB-like protein
VPLPSFRLSLLGRFELIGSGGPVHLSNKKVAGLLAYLASTAPRPQSREKLATLLWGSHSEAQARQNLRQAFVRLRRVLGKDALVGDGDEISLAPDVVDCDAVRFERLVHLGTRDALAEAVNVYQDRLLAEMNIAEEGWAEWLDLQRQRLEDLALDAMIRLGELELRSSAYDRALAAANRATSVSNVREDAHRLAIRALAAAGRKADALRHYDQFAALLQRELGAPPDEDTQTLMRELRQPAPQTQEPEPRKSSGATVGAMALLDQRSVAVLPFENISGDPTQDYLADGVAEEIITSLSRFSDLFVVARNSSFAYKGRTLDAKQIGQELGAGYLVAGSVRTANNRVRLSAQLIDCASRLHLWADSFEGGAEDSFRLQDEMTESVVGAIIPKLSFAEFGRVERKSSERLDAYDCYIRGFARFYEDTREAVSAAQASFYKAIDLDPSYALAFASAALCFWARKSNGWMIDFPSEVREAERLARRAAELAKGDAHAHGLSGFVLAGVVGDLDDGAALIERAQLLNPNLARAWQFSAWVRIWLGEPEQAIEHATRAMHFSPIDRWICSMQTAAGFGCFFMGRYDEATSWAAKAQRARPNFQPGLRLSAASNALSGSISEAQRAMRQLRQLNPALSLSSLKDSSAPFRRPEDFARYTEGLRKAGLQDD